MPAASCCACCSTIPRSRSARSPPSRTWASTSITCTPTCAGAPSSSSAWRRTSARATCSFVALPHGQVQTRIEELAALAPKIVDLSSDFRLRDPGFYAQWYGHEHGAPEWLDRFVYGLPELHRDEIRQASYVSGVGCNATATILGLYPLFQADLVDRTRGVIVEVKVGSSEGGKSASDASHHPERSGAVRSFAPTGHRHTAEVIQELTLGGDAPAIHFSGTAIELVRGVLATAHVFLKPGLGTLDRARPVEGLSRRVPERALCAHRQRAAGRLPLPGTQDLGREQLCRRGLCPGRAQRARGRPSRPSTT